ncbi:MAG: ribosome rescue protein RqcH [Candidatus Nezhaarchaeota archaeon]|nr:ribosome rescue protein RqcH [Candidatus Nezhaarchaeota archaeon]
MLTWTKLKPKRSLSALDIKALVKEMEELIVGGVITNVYIVEDLLMLKVRCNDGITRVLMSKPPYWISLSSYDVEKPLQPTTLCKLMRKLIRGLRITSLEQIGFDRIVKMRIEGRGSSYELIFELVREGNVIVCGSDMTILAAYREVEYKDRVLKRGVKYQPPPNVVLSLSKDRANEAIKESRSKAFYVAQALVGSPELAYEILARSSINPEAEASSLELIEKIVEKANELFNLPKVFKPCIVYVNDKPFSVVPLDFVIYSKCRKKTYDRFYEAVSDFFMEEVKKSLLKKEEVERERARIESSIKDVKEATAKLESKIEKMTKALEIMKRSSEEFQRLLDAFRDSWARGEDVPRSMPSIEGVKVVQINRRDKVVKIEIEGLELLLKPSESLMANISNIYDELKNLKKKLESSRRALAELESKLVTLMEKEKEVIKEAERKIRRRREPRYWYEKYLWFKSSDGFLVVAGRDATQNEVLVKKYLRDDDLFFHADIVGGAVVIVKSEGREVPQTTIEEVAQYSACYSKAWKAGFGSIDVYWVYGRQVSKTPPSGEYLPKGSFMVRGPKNFLRGVELKVAIGLTLLDGEVMVISGPPSAITRQSIAYVVLIPGDEERGRLASRIAKIFNEELKSMGLEEGIEVEDVLKVLPPGSAKIVEERTFKKSYKGE